MWTHNYSTASLLFSFLFSKTLLDQSVAHRQRTFCIASSTMYNIKRSSPKNIIYRQLNWELFRVLRVVAVTHNTIPLQMVSVSVWKWLYKQIIHNTYTYNHITYRLSSLLYPVEMAKIIFYCVPFCCTMLDAIWWRIDDNGVFWP